MENTRRNLLRSKCDPVTREISLLGPLRSDHAPKSVRYFSGIQEVMVAVVRHEIPAVLVTVGVRQLRKLGRIILGDSEVAAPELLPGEKALAIPGQALHRLCETR